MFQGRKVLQQVAHADLREKLSWNPTYFLLNPYLNGAILNFHIKKFHGHAKNHENHKTFLPRNFHRIRYV